MRPDPKLLVGKDVEEVPMSLQRISENTELGGRFWIGPDEASPLPEDEQTQYDLAHSVIRHLAISAPLAHKSGHPGGPLSAFTPAYWVYKLRDPSVDQPLRMSPGHLSILGYALIYLFGRDKGNSHLSTPQSIIEKFRTPDGLPGHIEAGLGDIPFGTGPLGKGVSHALGTAFGLQVQWIPGKVDVLLADRESQ